MQNQMNKLRVHLNVRILKEHRYSVGQKVDGNTTTKQLKMIRPQILFAHPEILWCTEVQNLQGIQTH